MTDDSSLFLKRIRHLSLALMVSGALNIGVLSLLIYWVARERPPTPYCELKPASIEQQQPPLADQRGCAEMVAQLSQLSFSELVNRLSNAQLVENGYAEQDLALACLVAFHHFDLQRALPRTSQPKQSRLLAWKPKTHEPSITLTVYPDLAQKQFEALIQFARTEQWPLTAEGLFLLLQKQKNAGKANSDLTETFMLTAEFRTVELLFQRAGENVSRTEILALLQEGHWPLLKQFVDQQRQLHDQSDAKRKKFLLDYLAIGSPAAASLLLKTEWEFSVKKLDDAQVEAILKVLPTTFELGKRFAMEMLTSPRGTGVWQQASHWLYKEAGETLPKEWNYQVILARFAPDKLGGNKITPTSVAAQVAPKPVIPSKSIIAIASPIKTYREEPVKPKPSPKTTNSRSYTVQEGDTLWKISRKFKIDLNKLKEANRLKSDTIKPGTTLQIPLEGA